MSDDEEGWTNDVLECLDRIGKVEFGIDDVYAFEDTLSKLHPDNNTVRPQIRKQLQILRELGLVEFLGSGRYRRL